MLVSNCETLFLILFTSLLLFDFNCSLSLHKNNPLDNDVLGSSEVNSNFPVNGNGESVHFLVGDKIGSLRVDSGKIKTDRATLDREIVFGTQVKNGPLAEEIRGQEGTIHDYDEDSQNIERSRRKATEPPPKSAQSTESSTTAAKPTRGARSGRYWKGRHRPHDHFGPPYFNPSFGPPPGPPPYPGRPPFGPPPGPGPWQEGPWGGPGDDSDEEDEYGDGFSMHHPHHHHHQHHHHNCGGDHGSHGKDHDTRPSKEEGGNSDDVRPVYENSTEDPNDNTRFGVELLTPRANTTDVTTKVPDIDIRFRVKDK